MPASGSSAVPSTLLGLALAAAVHLMWRRRSRSAVHRQPSDWAHGDSGGQRKLPITLALPLSLRPLEAVTNARSFLRLLAQLTEVGEISSQFFQARLAEVHADPGQLMLVVCAERTGAVVATGSVVVEPKFIHQAGLVGHIEDVVVEETLRGYGLGSRLVRRLMEHARLAGCYKCILDCKEENVPFYERLGFKRKEVMMAQYFHERSVANPSGHAQFSPQPQSDGLLIRRLDRADYTQGFLGLLAQLTTVGEIPPTFFEERLAMMEESKRQHMLVIADPVESRVVATATLLVERKFIHQAGFAGHIEDVVCDAGVRGRGLGKRIISAVVELARMCGCYKVILDCEDSNVGFYEKCGFQAKEVEMALYFDR